jgi:hypothetical protein
MTRIRLKYVQAFVNKETGLVFRYFRRPGCPRVRLPGPPGSAEFNRAYEQAMTAMPTPVGAARTRPGSLSARRRWLQRARDRGNQWTQIAERSRTLHSQCRSGAAGTCGHGADTERNGDSGCQTRRGQSVKAVEAVEEKTAMTNRSGSEGWRRDRLA